MVEALLLLIGTVPLHAAMAWSWQQYYGMESLTPYLIAWSTCVGFGMGALIAQEWGYRRGSKFVGTLGSILLRTLGPLFVCVLISVAFSELAESEIFPAFVCCYLLTLVSETILSVRLVHRWEARQETVSSS